MLLNYTQDMIITVKSSLMIREEEKRREEDIYKMRTIVNEKTTGHGNTRLHIRYRRAQLFILDSGPAKFKLPLIFQKKNNLFSSCCFLLYWTHSGQVLVSYGNMCEEI